MLKISGATLQSLVHRTTRCLGFMLSCLHLFQTSLSPSPPIFLHGHNSCHLRPPVSVHSVCIVSPPSPYVRCWLIICLQNSRASQTGGSFSKIRAGLRLSQSMRLQGAPLFRGPLKDWLCFRFCVEGNFYIPFTCIVSSQVFCVGPLSLFMLGPRNVLNRPWVKILTAKKDTNCCCCRLILETTTTTTTTPSAITTNIHRIQYDFSGIQTLETTAPAVQQAYKRPASGTAVPWTLCI